MIIDLSSTSTSAVIRKLMEIREQGGSIALGRVLNLVICTEDADAEEAIEAANSASRDHPCRVLVIARGSARGAARLDAQIRIGGDAGASEVIVLRTYGELSKHAEAMIMPLLLPDTPVVAWWPGDPPADLSADPIGRLAQRRVSDSSRAKRPRQALAKLAAAHRPGDTDLGWTRITRWRSLLAAALDQPPYEPVTSIVVKGASDSPSTELLAAWLAYYLQAPATLSRTAPGSGLVGVELHRPSGVLSLNRPERSSIAVLTQPGQPVREVSLTRRNDDECIAEELRRLDPDDVYGEVVTLGLPLVDPANYRRSASVRARSAASGAVESGSTATRSSAPDTKAAAAQRTSAAASANSARVSRATKRSATKSSAAKKGTATSTPATSTPATSAAATSTVTDAPPG